MGSEPDKRAGAASKTDGARKGMGGRFSATRQFLGMIVMDGDMVPLIAA